MQIYLSPLDIPPSTPTTSEHIPLKELGIPDEEEEEVLDITRLTFDQVYCNIMQERRRCYVKNPSKPLSMATEKNIVLDTIMNPEMISLVGTCFVTTTELNVRGINKKVVELQAKV